jgi:hypothetical protein
MYKVVATDGAEYGPYSEQDLVNYAREGRVLPGTTIITPDGRRVLAQYLPSLQSAFPNNFAPPSSYGAPAPTGYGQTSPRGYVPQPQYQPPASNTRNALIIGGVCAVIVIVIFGLFMKGFVSGFSKGFNASRSQYAPATAIPAYTVTDTQITSEYDSDDAAARQKYEGKTLLINGTFDHSRLDSARYAYLIMKPSGSRHRLMFRFTSDYHDQIAGMSQGQPVTVKAVDGHELYTVILLKGVEMH